MMVIGERGNVSFSESDGFRGASYRWRRDINGVPYAFTFVLMPSGELRWFANKYNGYCRKGVESGLMDMAQVLQFGCAWSPVHAITGL